MHNVYLMYKPHLGPSQVGVYLYEARKLCYYHEMDQCFSGNFLHRLQIYGPVASQRAQPLTSLHDLLTCADQAPPPNGQSISV